MQFQELSDKQWNTIEQYLQKPARTGRPRCDDRVTINGIMFVLVTGCRWRGDARKVRFQINCTPQAAGMAAKKSVEKDPVWDCKISPQTKQNQPAEDIS